MSKLTGQVIFGFARMMIVFGALVLIPAGTFSFRQAWLFLAVFFACSALIVAYLWKTDLPLLERRFNATPVDEKERSQKILHILMSLLFAGVLVTCGLDHRFAWSVMSWPFVALGNILVAGGLGLIFLVLKENRFAVSTIEVSDDQKVVSSGPYARVRHPMYTGLLILLLGTPLALASWRGLFLFVLLTIVIIWRLLAEEKFLAANLPGYPDYCRKVRYRLMPFVW